MLSEDAADGLLRSMKRGFVPQMPPRFEVGTKVHRRNLTHAGGKGDKVDFSFLEPSLFVVVELRNLCTL